MTLFPDTKEDFTAENGVTYTWDDNRWRTKAYKIDDSELQNYVSKTKNSTITDAYLRLEKVTKADTALVLDFKREEDGNANKSCRFIDFKEDNHRMMDIQSTAAGYTQIQLENDFKQFKIVGKVDGNLGQLFKVYTNGKVGLFNLRYPTQLITMLSQSNMCRTRFTK